MKTTYDEDKIEEQLNRRGDWYRPEDGLEAVRGVLQYLDGHPEIAKDHKDGRYYEGAIWDLRAFEAILLEAKKRKQRFRIYVGG